MLEVRLHELDAAVYRFVIVEAARTHSGRVKPLDLWEHRFRFRCSLSLTDKHSPVYTYIRVSHTHTHTHTHTRLIKSVLPSLRTPGDCSASLFIYIGLFGESLTKKTDHIL